MEFIPYRGCNTLSLRQIDTLNGVPKGTTFRAFKHCAALREDEDFFLVTAEESPETVSAWREAGLIYPASVSVVLLTEDGYRKLQTPPAD